ncbi:hypothetical protein [Algicella marina]|uniref:Flagellar FliJ protein n=1 Tax=Algicella marina TaxID=2683284 RepID=A0A6P1T0L7_9RHOB|nr:hypothetical protein [Algicella marina]QHQ36454.1 hypothetical protein GO499_15350 [Algicella marina]
MTAKTYEPLVRITEFGLTRDMARLAEINARIRKVQRRRLALRQTAVREMPETGEIAGGELARFGRWHLWAEQARRKLDAEEAAYQRELVHAMEALRRSYGKTSAVTRLAKKQQQADKRTRIARAERDGRASEE